MFQLKKFGDRLKLLRIQHDLTQQQLSDMLSISLVYVYKLESGSRAPSIDLCIQICTFFDVTLDYLLIGANRKLDAKGAVRQAICLLEQAEKEIP